MTNRHDELDDDWAAAMHEIAAREAPPGAAPADAPPGLPAAGTRPLPPPPARPPTAAQELDFILHVAVTLTAELGRRKLPIRDLLTLTPGTVIDLDSHSGDPIQVLINGTPVAKGDVVMVNDRLGIRLTDIISPAERLLQANP